jgi:hypothetical protein
MKQLLIICIFSAGLFAAIHPLKAQGLFQKATKTVYGLYGRHFSTNYIVDSGTTNLVSRKMNLSYEAGLNLDYPLSKKVFLRIGIFGHIHAVRETTFGTTGNYPSIIEPLVKMHYNIGVSQYLKGVEDVERVNISFPVKVLYKLKRCARWEWYIAGGAIISFYLPTQQEEFNRLWLLPDSLGGYFIKQYGIVRNFKRNALENLLQTSRPQIEWQMETEVVCKFRKKGALVGGLKASLGTTRLERADFVTWPQFPAYRSKGHYSLNRSYVGVYLGYRFGRNTGVKN